MKSIRSRLILAMTALIALYVFFAMFLNSQLLVRYYYLNKEATLKHNYQKINKIYTGEPFASSLSLEKLERTENLHIIILDENLNIQYYSSYKEGAISKPPRPSRSPDGPEMPESSIIRKAQKVENGEPIIEKIEDPRLNSEFLNLIGVLNNGDTIYMSTPVVAIEESAQVAKRFFSINGLLMILIGVIMAFLFANRFTKPILQLNGIAQEMAHLDFSKKVLVRSRDEIGQLGESLNSLSTQLEKSINELRQANEKLMADIEKERRIDEMRKEFISNVSHELKTPIALIQGYAEGLKLNVNEKEEDKNFYCDVIIDESAKMNKLVKELLDFSQIDSGYAKLDLAEFDLAQLIDYVLKKNALLLKENQIQLRMERPEELLVVGDVCRMEQVIVNYLINAIHHVDEHKEIRVLVEKLPTKARVEVFNSGDLIPEGQLERIWTSFYKADQARTRAYGGTGLGLSIVRAILELHQNAYGVENKEDGVSFWFEIDLAESAANLSDPL